MNLVRAISAIGSMTMLSRVFGFARDILIANYLGAGTVADTFVVAFRFPNLFRRLFAEGAFAAAFVPMFSRSLEGEGPDAAKKFAEQAFSVLALILFVFVAVVEVAMPWLMPYLAPGFDNVPGKMEMATEFSRIAFPYLLFISLVALQSGVLNAFGKFSAAAAAPVLLNITLIVALLAFGGSDEESGRALVWGVFAAGIVQFIWLGWHCKRQGVRLRLGMPKLTDKVRTLGRRILPVVFGASLYQINLLIGTILATTISDGAVSYLYYADRVTQLPLGVVGIAVGTALLPMISRQLEAGDDEKANTSQNRGIEIALLLTVPAALALIVIPEPIIQVLFERGAFGADASEATALALMAYAIGLPAYVGIRVFTPGYFAREDTATPVRIAALAMVVNVVLNLVLMQPFGHVGIALASSVSAWLNILLLVAVLAKRGHYKPDARLMSRLLGIAGASVVMAGALWFAAAWAVPWLAGPLVEQVAALTILVVGGLALYLIAARLFRVYSISEIKGTLRRAR
ncbi:MAG: murein biosynthesis integral membrane protein MurJ [Rhodospirillales bacterium]|nr:murein biosynthesis integral membrane protein MurJ [Rhodospirillales bacterium]